MNATSDDATDGGSGTTGSTGQDEPPPANPAPECELVASADDFPPPDLGMACAAYLDPRDLWTVPMRFHNTGSEPVIVALGKDPRIESPDGAWHHPLDAGKECSCEELLVNSGCAGPDGPWVPPYLNRIEAGGVAHHVWRGYLARNVTLRDACATSLECHETARAEPGPYVSVMQAASATDCQEQTDTGCDCTVTTDGSCSLTWPDNLLVDTIRLPFELGQPCDGVDIYID